MKLEGRVICPGRASGPVLFTGEPLLIYGGLDTRTGIVVERGHPLEGTSVRGRVLVFPMAKGSTVGSYTLLQLAKNGLAPAAIINAFCEPIVATGAIMSRIPCVDKVDIALLKDAIEVEVSGGTVSWLNHAGDE